MAKFHINQKDGNVGVCRAEKGGCPFGGDEVHFTSMVAAAEAFEKSMEAEIAKTLKKAPTVAAPVAPKSDAPELVVPAGYKVDEASLGTSEKFEVGKYDEAKQETYYALRSTSPAVTHREATNLLYNLEKAESESSIGYKYFASTISGNEYDKANEYIDTAAVTSKSYYSPRKTLDSLNKGLWDDTKRLVLQSRPYGFPEDEMSRHNMDEAEGQQLKALSVFTGKDPKEIRTDFIKSVPVERHGLDKLSDAELASETKYLNGLQRLSSSRKLQKERYNRETAIRRLAKEKDGWSKASEVRKGTNLSDNEITSLLGKGRD